MLLDTPICDFGWKAPDFTLRDPDGHAFTMSQHLGENGLLVAFLCNHCPYVQAIADRLAEDTSTLLDEGIGVLGVMSNDYRAVPTDGPAYMRSFAARSGWRFPYLIDEDQSVGKAWGAVCTPDFFGLNAQGELQYRGRLDNTRLGSSSNRTRELVEAMRQISQSGHGPEKQMPSMGCSLKWRKM
ncbi:thioredoxin family protein [Ruegeria profundi]|uniref:thioredoxin family protein n=1 Tax=Ruegeria profundi TaxID=1685378 RepID=UPI001CD7F448|nr:thioredoxin family protein [Ruegeria profundi]MCA0930114.1 thioredoxin family protein [Ruegeria profundi]